VATTHLCGRLLRSRKCEADTHGLLTRTGWAGPKRAADDPGWTLPLGSLLLHLKCSSMQPPPPQSMAMGYPAQGMPFPATGGDAEMRDRRMEYSGAWSTGAIEAPVRRPLAFCCALCCGPCVSYALRKRALHGDMTRCVACQRIITGTELSLQGTPVVRGHFPAPAAAERRVRLSAASHWRRAAASARPWPPRAF